MNAHRRRGGSGRTGFRLGSAAEQASKGEAAKPQTGVAEELAAGLEKLSGEEWVHGD
jgi:hypothetical protein